MHFIDKLIIQAIYVKFNESQWNDRIFFFVLCNHTSHYWNLYNVYHIYKSQILIVKNLYCLSCYTSPILNVESKSLYIHLQLIITLTVNFIIIMYIMYHNYVNRLYMYNECILTIMCFYCGKDICMNGLIDVAYIHEVW